MIGFFLNFLLVRR